MSTSNSPRRAAIEGAIAKAERPKPPVRVTDLHSAGEIARRQKEPTVGGMTKLLYALPAEDQRKVREVANLYAAHRDAGRHGDKQSVLDHFGIPADLAEAVVNGLEVDHVAAELQRRMGSDGNRPLPELTRRDHIDAAIDAHSNDSPVPARPAPKLSEATRQRDAHYAKVTDERLNEGETQTETVNQRGHLARWGSRRKTIEDAYNLHDRKNDMRQGTTPAQEEAGRGKLRRWGGE